MSADATSSITEVLSLVEKFGAVVVPARSVEALANVDARAALHAAGVITAAAAAATWPCDVRGCSREIRGNYDGARKPLVAVCCQAPAACMPVELGFDEVAQQEVSTSALVTAACGVLGAVIDPAALGKVRERRALGEARLPVLVATIAAPARDVFWACTPRDMDLAAFCGRRERAPRGTLVLVPTGKYVPIDVAARFCAGEHVEVCALSDALEVRDGKLRLAGPTGAILPEPKPEPAQSPTPAANHGVASLIGAERWEDIRILVVDGHTLRIEAHGKSVLRTFVELGFVDGRKTDVVAPTNAWSVLLVFCAKGYLRPSEYGQIGKAYGAKKAVEAVKRTMREAFGLEDPPIGNYIRSTSRWVARFRVGESASL